MTNKDYAAQGRKYEFISSQHGGYWRHDFIDHAYLYNLYFPPESFFEKLKDQIHDLVLNYPLAQDALAALVGEFIDQPPERIVVGNGAAELIKIVSGHIAQKLILPVPSFNEYANAVPNASVIEFPLEPDTFQLDVDKFAAEIIRSKADIAVVVTPNNPTSLLVPKSDLLRLLDKISGHDCMLIVDESFIDFAHDRNEATLEGEIARHQNLTIFKSLSKAYGICGLRIGYMLTANSEFAARVRDGIHIWNINGFAETFLELVPQYRKDFSDSCRQVMADRDKFYEELKSIPGLTVFKPDANYIFCRLPEHAASGPEITKSLFVEHNIYIKHCKGKTMPESDRYLRIASRTQAENHKLIEALRGIIGVAGS
jgi:histidinol-phosphate/aromatic aminotransferase/cobyric acid decarboxylase-like protein